MREAIYFVASVAGAAVLTALAVLVSPQSLFWQAVLYGGIAILILCAATLLIDIVRRRFKSDQIAKAGTAVDPAKIPPRDIPIMECIWRVCEGRWVEPSTVEVDPNDPKMTEYWKAVDKIRQSAFEGKLPIWAMRQHSSLYEPVPPEFWEDHWIIQTAAMRGTIFLETRETLKSGGAFQHIVYDWNELMTNKGVVERLWPENPKSPSAPHRQAPARPDMPKTK